MIKCSNSHKFLNYHQVYRCPVCRHGEIANLILMEAFSCNFCQHIFTANIEQQILRIADSQLALAWHWTGEKWESIKQDKIELDWVYWLAGVIFVLLPTTLIALAIYFFPPLPGSTLAWFPFFWLILTFLAHFLGLICLIIEYYQFPLSQYIAAISQRLFQYFFP
jgi:hypothetical protein